MKPFKSCLAAAAFLLLARGAAAGCGCVSSAERPTPQEARAALVKDYNGALAVFSGKVVALDTFKVTFKLDKVWKGASDDELAMSTGAKDNGDGSYTSTSCDFDFALGGEYLVFAYAAPGEEMQARQCTRTRSLKDAARDVQDLDEVWPHEKRNVPPPPDPADP
jgi:hypothetical protein